MGVILTGDHCTESPFASSGRYPSECHISCDLDVHFVSPAPVERHARVGGHPVPMASSPGFPLSRE